jgi:hypothetical protein
VPFPAIPHFVCVCLCFFGVGSIPFLRDANGPEAGKVRVLWVVFDLRLRVEGTRRVCDFSFIGFGKLRV